MKCPRREESFVVYEEREEDVYREDGTCSYCGSLSSEAFMGRLEVGDVKLTPTDKNYKVYVKNDGGEGFKQTYRDCYSQGANDCTPENCTHWVTREISETKFYFQHLSEDQKKRFIELLNERKIKLEYPGRFYVLPFFLQKVSA